jgi:hypothetical protein
VVEGDAALGGRARRKSTTQERYSMDAGGSELRRTTLPFSCPLDATNSGMRQQRPAQNESEKAPDSADQDQQFTKAKQGLAKRG